MSSRRSRVRGRRGRARARGGARRGRARARSRARRGRLGIGIGGWLGLGEEELGVGLREQGYFMEEGN